MFITLPIHRMSSIEILKSTAPTASGCLIPSGGAMTRKRVQNALKRFRNGKPIGFTMTASLKARGLIPRTSKKARGKRVKSRKYR